MAKPPANKKAGKPKAGPKVKPKTKSEPKPSAKSVPPLDDLPVDEPACVCCSACAGLATGTWGLPYVNAAGVWACLEGPTIPGSVKRLGADENGPYFAAP